MTLTTHIKHARVNVSTGETDHDYYDETEWAEVLVDQARGAVRSARTAKRDELLARAAAEVDAVIPTADVLEAQLRALEILEAKLEGTATPEDRRELVSLKQKRRATKAIRVREAVALDRVDQAADIASIKAITL